MYILVGNPWCEIARPDRPQRRTGGPVLAMGATLAGLGMPVAAVGHGGVAERESLIASGIDHRLFTCSSRSVTIDQQLAGETLHATPGETISSVEIPFDLSAVHGVVLCPSMGELEGFTAPPWFHERTLVSAAGFLRHAPARDRPGPVERSRSETLDGLRRTCRVVHAIESDAIFLTGFENAEAACRALHTGEAGEGLALVTRGRYGTILYDGTDIYHADRGQDDPRCHEIVAAAFLFACLHSGLSAPEALEFAAAAGRIAAAKHADPQRRGWPWPSLREVEEALATG